MAMRREQQKTPGIAEQRASNEVVKLIRKLRWMGMDEEAKVLENQLALDGFPVADCVIGVSRETD
jgi:hypothetical protein